MTITTSRQERPVIFPSGEEQLFGIITRPSGASNGITVLTLWGGGDAPRFGKNQVRTRFARELADRGFHVLRFDYRGIAESSGGARPADLRKPWVDDMVAAVRWLESQGLDRIVLVGLCLGGTTALSAAELVPGLAGIAVVAAPVTAQGHRDAILAQPLSAYARRAATWRSIRLLVGGEAARRRRRVLAARLARVLRPRHAPQREGNRGELLRRLWAVRERGIPVLFLYGHRDDFYPEFERLRAEEPGQRIGADELSTVHVVRTRLDGLANISAQEAFLDTVVAWAERIAARDGAAGIGEEGNDD